MVSIQRALLGAISDDVAVTCGFPGTEIRINAYFHSQPSKQAMERISCVATEVAADFSEPYVTGAYNAARESRKLQYSVKLYF